MAKVINLSTGLPVKLGDRKAHNGGRIAAALTVSTAANQAMTAEIQHVIRVDSPEVLAVGTPVKIVDDDLGELPPLKIYEVEPNRAPGEGVIYRCADLYRTLQKQPARLACDSTVPPYTTAEDPQPGSSKIHLDAGMRVDDALDAVLKSVQALFPGGVRWDGAEPDPMPTLHDDLDKGGQSIAAWIDDILGQTPDLIARVGWVAGEGGLARALIVSRFGSGTPLELIEAQGRNTPKALLNPAQPLLLTANVKRTLNDKYRGVAIEGAGKFARRIPGLLNNMEFAQVWAAPIDDVIENPVWVIRLLFYFPETNVTDEFWDKNGKLAHGAFLNAIGTIHYMAPTGDQPYTPGEIPVSTLLRDHHELDPRYDPAEKLPNPFHGRMYCEVDIVIGSPGAHHDGKWFPPVFDFSAGTLKARYTALIRPLVIIAESGVPELAGEGEFQLSRPEFYQFDSAGYADAYDSSKNEVETHVDDSAVMLAIAQRYVARYSGRVHQEGTARVLIHGATGGVTVGKPLANFGGGLIVRSLKLDLIARTIDLDVSDSPIRDFIDEAKDLQAQKSQQQHNYASGDTATGDDHRTQTDKATDMPDFSLEADCAAHRDANPVQSGLWTPVSA